VEAAFALPCKLEVLDRVGDIGRAPAVTIAASRACAPAMSCGISSASGRFFQYFFGISDSMAETFSRAGLKIAA
jgi:hypothetical protein